MNSCLSIDRVMNLSIPAINPPLTLPRRGTRQAVRRPSWEGLEVGSWSQCMRTNEKGIPMNLKVGRVSPLRAVSAVPSRGAHGVTRPTGSWSRKRMRKNSGRGLSMNPASESQPPFGKRARPKTHALQSLRDLRASSDRAKRLECVRFIGAFRPADRQRFPGPKLCAQND
jgi:hypothetical protein